VEPEAVFDTENYTLDTNGSRQITVELFQKVLVRVSDVKEESTGKRNVKLELLR
jgi:exosome complex exonuclease DIS3/RRP44